MRVAEDYLYVNTRLVYRVRFAGRDRFRLQLPRGAELVSLDTRNQQARSVEGSEIELVLQSPVTGEHVVDLAFRIPRALGERPSIAPVTLMDGGAVLETVDAYVGVLQTGQAILAESTTQGLSRLDAERLPYVPQGVASRNLRPAYRATSVDWSLALEEQEIEETAGVAAVAKLAEVKTVIAGDGTTRTEVLYTLSNRTLQFLNVQLPPGARLWGVTLDGKPVAVGRSGDPADTSQGMTIEVPVEYVGSAHLDLEVGLRYEEPDLSLGGLLSRTVELAAPRVTNVEVLETLWTVTFPQGFEIWQSGGNMRRVSASVGHAKKVENLLEQQDKIMKVARDSQSRRQRTQARRELERLEQELGDNLAELEESYQNEAAAERTVTDPDAPRQRALQGQLIQQAQKAQRDNRAARVDEDGKSRSAERSQVEQAFRDNANFLQRGNWRGGRKKNQNAPPRPDARGTDDIGHGTLRDLGVEPLVESQELAQEEELRAAGGLPALEKAAPCRRVTRPRGSSRGDHRRNDDRLPARRRRCDHRYLGSAPRERRAPHGWRSRLPGSTGSSRARVGAAPATPLQLTSSRSHSLTTAEDPSAPRLGARIFGGSLNEKTQRVRSSDANRRAAFRTPVFFLGSSERIELLCRPSWNH